MVQPANPTPIYLAIDYGMKRIGLAVGTPLTAAKPLTQIVSSIRSEQLAAITLACREWQATAIVLGIPVASQDLLLHNAIRKLSHQLIGHLKLPLFFADESYSSAEAKTRLEARGHHGRAQKPLLDQEAAAVLLDAWLATHHP